MLAQALQIGHHGIQLGLALHVGRGIRDLGIGVRVAEALQAFKIGINAPRSRGDREEIFGGKGASWKGAFVGGDLLVQAVTEPADGTSETLFGNFPSYSLYPPTAGLPA